MAKAKALKAGFKKIGDKIVKKRMTAAQRKEMSKKIQKEDFPKEKPTSKLTRKELDKEVADAVAKPKGASRKEQRIMAAKKLKSTRTKPLRFKSGGIALRGFGAVIK
jgi:hypothetical protein